MSREIKVRVWFENEMIYKPNKRFGIEINDDGVICLTQYNWEVDPIYYKMMQYIGMKDKERNDICEGDIIRKKDHNPCSKCGYDGEMIAKIEWSEEDLCFELINKDGESSLSLYDQDEIEIIGNAYENPELLEVV